VGTRLLILGAGSGAGNNLVSSLRRSLPELTIIGCHEDPFVLKQSTADRAYLLPGGPHIGSEIVEIVRAEAVDLVIPTSDAHVRLLSDNRAAFGSRVYLPSTAVIDLCEDKCDLALALARHGVPVPVSLPITDRETIEELVAKLAWAPRLWCRARAGTRSLGATPVASAAHIRAWLLLWDELRGIPPSAFMLAEYLPGRDFLCQSLWHEGQLVLVKTFERIAYFGGENSPSGVSSLSSLAKTIADDRVVDVCARAIRALDPHVSGAFSIDLKENAQGLPCITEINAGRFFIGMTALDHVGRHSMSACFVRLALGEAPRLEHPYDCPPDYYLVRDLDTPPGIFAAGDILDGLLRVTG
jgi:hypothetical protein